MDDGARKWLLKTALNNYWRVAKFYQLDDLVQDGYYFYYLIRASYPTAVDPPHIMQLFKVSYINHIHDLAKGTRSSGMGSWITRTDTVPWLSGDSDETGGMALADEPDIRAWIADAPPTVASLLRAILDHGEALRAPFVKRENGTRETFNERLCTMMGLDPHDFDLHTLLLNYLRGKDELSMC